jgi:ribosomal protein L29
MEVVVRVMSSKAKANVITAVSPAIKRKIAVSLRRTAQEGRELVERVIPLKGKLLALEAAAAVRQDKPKRGHATSVRRRDTWQRIAGARR